MEIKGANILLTGGCGFIGSQLLKNLVSSGANITVLDIFLNPKSIFAQDNLAKFVNLKFIDIRDRKKVLDIFKKCKPSYVIHLAAQPLVEEAYRNPYDTFQTNIMGTVNILDAARVQDSIKAVIVASSDKAYGKAKKAYKEDGPLSGDHPYDVSKSCEDLIAQSYYKTYNLPIVITRFANVYGEGDFHFGRIIPDICKAIIKKETLFLRSNGKYIRDYIYVNDVVNGYIYLLKNAKKIKGEAFNFSSQDNLSVIEVIKRSEKVLKIKIPFKILNKTKNEIPFQHLNYSKIRKIGWRPKYNLENSLGRTLLWYKTILDK
ncbi:MAG: GDP-mannose 4,6-dehydratase [Candidatus Daviesbacteria bacterium]|nr:GDP-mannose 4,6-dehydratase [Candidatus Daviesbacteria bacterium]